MSSEINYFCIQNEPNISFRLISPSTDFQFVFLAFSWSLKKPKCSEMRENGSRHTDCLFSIFLKVERE